MAQLPSIGLSWPLSVYNDTWQWTGDNEQALFCRPNISGHPNSARNREIIVCLLKRQRHPFIWWYSWTPVQFGWFVRPVVPMKQQVRSCSCNFKEQALSPPLPFLSGRIKVEKTDYTDYTVTSTKQHGHMYVYTARVYMYSSITIPLKKYSLYKKSHIVKYFTGPLFSLTWSGWLICVKFKAFTVGCMACGVHPQEKWNWTRLKNRY